MNSDEQAIRASQQAWFEATANGDLPGLLPLMADDVVFLTPGRPPFGKETFATNFAAGLQHASISCHGEFEDVVVVGDVAYARGRLTVRVTPIAGGEAKILSGYTLSVFRRQPNGTWVLVRDANLVVPDQGTAQ